MDYKNMPDSELASIMVRYQSCRSFKGYLLISDIIALKNEDDIRLEFEKFFYILIKSYFLVHKNIAVFHFIYKFFSGFHNKQSLLFKTRAIRV